METYIDIANGSTSGHFGGWLCGLAEANWLNVRDVKLPIDVKAKNFQVAADLAQVFRLGLRPLWCTGQALRLTLSRP